MKTDDLGDRMRSLEYFHSIRLLPGVWAIIRVDGRSFSRFTEGRFEKPFDLRFRDLMLNAGRALLQELGGLYACTHSDEISVLLPRNWNLWDRELEKLVSISAGIASAAFTSAAGEPAHFDSRIWLGAEEALVLDYFRWRQSDAGRCALNGWCYWTLRGEGIAAGEAERALSRQSWSAKHELLFQRGINFNDLPPWQRRGVGLLWEEYERPGTDPRTGATVTTRRRRIRVEEELPMKDDYAAMIAGLVEGEKRG